MTFIKRLTMHGFKSFAKKTEIPFDTRLNVILGPNGAGKSCRWDTEVLLSSGKPVKIGELVESNLINSQKLEDGFMSKENPNNLKIMTLNKDTAKIEEKSINAFIKHEGESFLYELTTRFGKKVVATGCHPIMIFKDNEIKSEIVENLSTQEFIASPRTLSFPEKDFSVNGIKIDAQFARFMGYLLGDGYIRKDRLDLTNSDISIINDFKNILRGKFNIENPYERKDKNSFRVIIYNKEIIKAVYSLLDDIQLDSITSINKKIPEKMFVSNKEVMANLIGALFDCDGYTSQEGHYFEFANKSERMIDQLQTSLLRFNIISIKKKKFKAATNAKNKEKREYFSLYVYGRDSLSNLYNNIPMLSSHKVQRLKAGLSKISSSNPNIDLLPRDLNILVRECSQTLFIKPKVIRSEYPILSAYMENRCCPSRNGLNEIITLFESKLMKMGSLLAALTSDFSTILSVKDGIGIPNSIIALQAGLSRENITNRWDMQKCQPRQENLEKVCEVIKKEISNRMLKATGILAILRKMSNSDVLWDQIVSIKKVGGEDWVYDLSVEGNHNFIANNLFVHNSNITDAICFVLGRLSAKSMRAARASNLIYNGGKTHSPSPEAMVELLLDNSSRVFSIDKPEVSISRTVRKNGISIYKVNNEVKTRQEILELMSQAGIDPNGFNIILQQEISRFVEMHPEERRGVMEEVAGISIYEDRKNKSMNELNRTDEKLKEVRTILNERTAYLRNLDKERGQALNYEGLRKSIERDKAALLFRQLEERRKESEDIDRKIKEKEEHITKSRESIAGMESKISFMSGEIEKISKHIEQATGVGQEQLHQEVAQCKSEVAVLEVRLENQNQQLASLEARKEQLEKELTRSLDETEALKSSLPRDDLKKLLQSKNTSLSALEEKKDKLDKLRTELIKVTSDLYHSRNNFSYMVQKAGQLAESISSLEKQTPRESSKIESVIEKIRKSILDLESMEKDKQMSSNAMAESNREIFLIEKLKKDIRALGDVCPVCKRKVTAEHIKEVHSKADSDIKALQKKLENSANTHRTADEMIKALKNDLTLLNETASKLKVMKVSEDHLNEKRREKEIMEEEVRALESNINSLEKKAASLEVEIRRFGDFEKTYNQMREEFKELTKKNDSRSQIELKILSIDQEIERIKEIIKKHPAEKKILEASIKDLGQQLKEKRRDMGDKEGKEKALYETFDKLFKKKSSLQDNLRELEKKNVENKMRLRSIEDEVNTLKIAMAKTSAELETSTNEFEQYKHLDIESLKLKQSRNEIESRIKRNEIEMIKIGTVNLRALEVYDQVKDEYEKVNDKVMKLEQEKHEILNVMSEIDRKKKTTFMRTFESINGMFTNNFLKLGGKESFLSLENRENPFEGGVNIDVKLAKGKYLDVNSLSGGERTLVALSLIFAIQELKPYHFYIFDEIDAALDKKNTERLSDLLRAYIKNAQYIVITHNDHLISDSPVLFGVSMQDGVSKVLSLRV